ncbi:hypothetical protein [Stutzerimonas tarimensis]|uniref:Uncharacterized protein n=1 Tax=Stutzerimonas tarimensis TaxID=1507735 RepID=A0ABV7T380_9GAMM
MESIKSKRLTDNQRRTLTVLLKKHDLAMTNLIVRAKDTSSMSAASDKLSTNLDFKKKVLAYWDALKNACIKQGVYIPIFEEAFKLATYELNQIIPGQPRDYVRQNLNMTRCTFFYKLISDEKNVNFDFSPNQPDTN